METKNEKNNFELFLERFRTKDDVEFNSFIDSLIGKSSDEQGKIIADALEKADSGADIMENNKFVFIKYKSKIMFLVHAMTLRASRKDHLIIMDKVIFTTKENLEYLENYKP